MRRKPNLPRGALTLAGHVSKTDLLEAAWSLASLCNDAGSADDNVSTLLRLVEEIRAHGRRVGEGTVNAALARIDEEPTELPSEGGKT